MEWLEHVPADGEGAADALHSATQKRHHERRDAKENVVGHKTITISVSAESSRYAVNVDPARKTTGVSALRASELGPRRRTATAPDGVGGRHQ